jgi:hypothetical protein
MPRRRKNDATHAHRRHTDILRSFTAAHLEEEIRRETMVRDWGVFERILALPWWCL